MEVQEVKEQLKAIFRTVINNEFLYNVTHYKSPQQAGAFIICFPNPITY